MWQGLKFSPWKQTPLILWAFFPRVFIYAWTLCFHFPHHELNCVFRIGPHVYRLLTTEKQSLTGLLAYYIYTPILKFYWASLDDFFIYIIINRSLSTAAWASLLLALRPLTDIQWRRRSNSSNFVTGDESSREKDVHAQAETSLICKLQCKGKKQELDTMSTS